MNTFRIPTSSLIENTMASFRKPNVILGVLALVVLFACMALWLKPAPATAGGETLVRPVVLPGPNQPRLAAGATITSYLYLPVIMNTQPRLPPVGTATTTPTPTAISTPTATPTRTPTPTATATQAIGFINGDFEQATAGWTRASDPPGYEGLIGTADFLGSTEITPRVYPRSGIYMARLGGFNYMINEIYQTVTLPNVTPLYMTFYYQIRGWSGGDCGYYGGLAKIFIGGANVYEHCIYGNTPADWTKGVIDLSAIHGQTVQIVFHVESAASGYWNYLYLDDIALGQTP